MRYGQGRFPSPPDARDYALAELMEIAPAPRYSPRNWHSDRVLNQGRKPHCVGFGWAGWGICTPVESRYYNSDGHSIYNAAKKYDGIYANMPGSTLRSGAKAMLSKRRIKSYYFARNIAEAEEFVAHHGPVVLGIDWYEGMMQTDTRGLISPTGLLLGGHCVLWKGVIGNYAVIRNSWGTGWGVGGDCKMLLRDLGDIYLSNGEACAAVENPVADTDSFLHELYTSVVNLIRKG
jgi:hypothetical protein